MSKFTNVRSRVGAVTRQKALIARSGLEANP